MSRLILGLVVLCVAGCGQHAESPPELPALGGPLPGPPVVAPSMELPKRISESLAILDDSGKPVTSAVMGTMATVEYRCQLPSGWGKEPNQPLAPSRVSHVLLQFGTLINGKFVIGSEQVVTLKHADHDVAFAKADMKLPMREDTEWKLLARLIQGLFLSWRICAHVIVERRILLACRQLRNLFGA